MRVGHNPNAGARVDNISPVVLFAITHLPNNTTAYHAKRLEVIQTCLSTMRRGAKTEHTFVVWDNGSIPELRQWLQWEFRPDMLMLSENIGKTAARTSIFRMLPPETIVACSDDDIFYYDDWLAPQIELLQKFPRVACVTGYPVRTAFRWGCENTKKWAKKNAKLESGTFLPREWENDFAVSIGRDPKWHEEYTKDDTDWLISYKGLRAYATSHHCQFVSYAKTVAGLNRYDGAAMGDEKPFDIALDKAGLRLATTTRLTRHIGNVLDDWMKGYQ